jgi:ABC-type transport system involved in multi-copper enzyme maturation permease subunit
MNTISAMAGIVIKELYRRKDFYVLFVLTALITVLMGLMRFFDDAKIIGYVKEICLMLVSISALVIAITTAARQIPAERENRTIFPLLAKPVTRGQVLVGKFLGSWLATGIALVVFYLFFGILSGSHENRWPVLIFLEAFWLQWMMLSVVIALVVFGSVTFSAPSANITICMIVVLGILTVGEHLNQVAVQQKQPVGSIISAIYFMIPHLEWFDIHKLVLFNQPPVPWVYCLLASLYAAGYTAVFLFAAWLAFRHKPLTA